MTREQILQKYPEVKITTEDLEEGANKIENKDAQLESEQDSLKFNYHENEQFKADEKSLIDESNNINFQPDLSNIQLPLNEQFAQNISEQPEIQVQALDTESPEKNQQLEISAQHKNHQSLEKEDQSNFNEQHQKMKIQHNDQI